MGRCTRMLLIALTIFFGLTTRAHATTYYIAANGSDSNSGTVNTSPWQHAPGMPNCIANCAKTIPQPGDSFIFRGGDAWHLGNSGATPYTGGTWVWQWSGSSANCNYPTTVSSCIYIGTDQTWYSGASFTRPALDFDNPGSTSLVASCAYGDLDGVDFGNSTYRNVNYVIFDNFELHGKCWSSTNPHSWISQWGIYLTFKDLYFHGWTEVSHSNSQCCEDDATMIAGTTQNINSVGGQTHNIITYVVADGSDSYCTGGNACSGGPLLSNDAYEMDHSVCRRMANCLAFGVYNFTAAHDNLFEYVYESWDSFTHSNVIEQQGEDVANATPAVYDNIFRHIDTGMTLALYGGTGSLHVFNNAFFDVANGTNCVQISTNGNPGGVLYFTNNTVDNTTSTCQIRATPNSGQYWNGRTYFQNNHLIAISSLSSMENCSSGSTCTWTDSGNEVFQSESTANSQGYTPNNNYQPTSTSGATYHAGTDLSLQCANYSSDMALCSGSTGGVANLAGGGVIPIPMILQPALRAIAWDAGAYQYSGNTSSQPLAPTGLVAAIQ